MPFGERIGQAYVRVILDGDNKPFLDGLKAGELDKAGADAGKTFSDAFDEELGDRGKLAPIQLNKALAKGDGIMHARGVKFGDFMADGFQKTLKRRLEGFGPQISKLVQKEIGERLRVSGDTKQTLKDLENLTVFVERAVREQHRLNLENIKDFELIDELLQGHNRKLTQTNAELRDMRELSARAAKNMEFRELGRLEKFFAKRQINQFNRDLDRTNLFANRLDRTFRKVGDGIGIAFGRGSRNNFLNFVGSASRNLFNVITRGMTGVIRGATTLGKTLFSAVVEPTKVFVSGLRAGAGVFTSMIEAGKTFGQILGAAAVNFLLNFNPVGLITLTVGFVAAAAAASLLVSGLSLLLGVVTALAGSISFALVGAIGSLVAVLTPAIALFGGFIVAMKSLTQTQVTAAKVAFQKFSKPFTKAFRDEMPAALRAFDQALNNVEVKRFADRMGSAIGKVVTSFAKALNSPAFAGFAQKMSVFLPNAVTRLGKIMRQTFAGFGGLLTGMIPFMDRVLKRLDDLTAGFARWANSPKGQEQIDKFFRKTEASAKSLGRFLKQLFGLMGDLLGAGRATGDTIFDSMARSLARFRANIKGNPLATWFADAKRFAGAIGSLIKGVGSLMNALDSPVGRNGITALINLTGTLLIGLSKVVGAFDNIGGKLVRWIPLVGGYLESAFGSDRAGDAKRTADSLKAAGEAMQGFTMEAEQAGQKSKAAFTDVRDAVNQTRNSLILSTTNFKNAFRGTADSVRLTQAGVEKYRSVLQTMPTKLLTQIVAEGLPTAKKEMLVLARLYNLTPKQVETLVKLTGGKLTKEDLKFIRARMDEITNKPANPTIHTGSVENATIKFKNLKDAVNQFKTAMSQVTIPKSITDLPGYFARLGDTLGGGKGAKNIPLKVSVDANSVKAVTDKVANAVKGPHKAKVDVRDGGSIGNIVKRLDGLQKTMLSVNRFDPKINITHNAPAVVKRLDGLLKTMLSVHKFDPKVDIKDNVGTANSRINSVRSNLNRLNGKTSHVYIITHNQTKGARGGLMQDGQALFAKGGVLEKYAHGGFANFKQLYGNAIIGESGKEAIVPLHRPLGQVDPSVRLLSAVAQGKLGVTTNNDNSTGTTINQTIVSNSEDPSVVAAEVLNRLTAASY